MPSASRRTTLVARRADAPATAKHEPFGSFVLNRVASRVLTQILIACAERCPGGDFAHNPPRWSKKRFVWPHARRPLTIVERRVKERGRLLDSQGFASTTSREAQGDSGQPISHAYSSLVHALKTVPDPLAPRGRGTCWRTDRRRLTNCQIRQVDDAELVGRQLIDAVSAREQAQGIVAQAQAQRQRNFTLFARSYNQAR